MVSKSDREIIWSLSAFKKYEEILHWHKTNSQTGPKIVKESIEKTLKTISKNPLIFEMDHLKNEPEKSVRFFVVCNIRVSYSITESKINILRLRHTSQEPLEF